ncbi:MAG TPA: adenylate/guanylate cyclase domain-containing protein [Myxococcales bacterium]
MLRRLTKITAFKLALLIGLVFAVTHFMYRATENRHAPFTLVEAWDAKALDAKFKVRGPVPSSGRVTIAGIDEVSLQRYGLWPWRRELVGKALKNLNDAGAAAIGVDIWFADADRHAAHLSVNRMIDAALGQLPDPAGDLAAAGWSGSPDRLVELRGSFDSMRLADPDVVFADFLRESPKVVLGASGYPTPEAIARADKTVLQRDEQALERFTFTDVYAFGFDPETKQEIKGTRWSPLFKTKASAFPQLRALLGVELSLPAITAATANVGLIDTEPDEDGTIRKYPLISRLKERIVPSLALQTAAVAMGGRVVPLMDPEASTDSISYAGLMPLDGTMNGAAKIPLDPKQARYLIDYPGSFRAVVDGKPLFQTISFADAVDGTFDVQKVKGQIILVGATVAGTFDQRVTPFDSMSPGVYTHAAVIDNILTGSFLQQSLGVALFEVLILLLLALAFGLVVPRFEAYYWQAVFMLGAFAAYLALDLQLFKAGYELSTVVPMMEIACLFAGMLLFKLVVTDREKRQTRTAFQHYLAPSVLDDMVKNPDKLKLGGEKRELTVFFSDIRGFTTISERLPAEELSKLLNEYLTPMSNIVFKHQGTLDKYMGDAVMAFWGAPMEQPDHALRGCTAAIEMMKTLDVLRAQWKAAGRPDIQIGIGLNSGPMSVGNMGSNMFFNYTVMGDNVNLGSRLEGTNKAYGTNIIISEFTFAKVKGQVVARELGSVRVKGKKLPVGIYELRGLGTPPPAEAAVIADFEAGIAAYRARNWDEAEARFKKVLETWKDDGPSAHYLEDTEDKRRHPPAEGWDGVYEMKTK